MNRNLLAALGAAGLVLACSSAPPSPAPAEDPSVLAETSSRNAKLILARVPCNGCIDSVRGALNLDGVQAVDIAVGRREFSVTYNPAMITVATMVEALKKKGEKATVAY